MFIKGKENCPSLICIRYITDGQSASWKLRKFCFKKHDYNYSDLCKKRKLRMKYDVFYAIVGEGMFIVIARCDIFCCEICLYVINVNIFFVIDSTCDIISFNKRLELTDINAIFNVHLKL